MSEMGRYCKAYSIHKLRGFNGWTENSNNARSEKQTNGEQIPRALTENDYLYLQENFTVTDGVFLGENVIFDRVTADWVDYCKTTLNFEVPEYDADTSSQDGRA